MVAMLLYNVVVEADINESGESMTAKYSLMCRKYSMMCR